mmetsp:Transcript_11601/g.24488  ORF Transcript_11601/g.24488 Transcript_11601/m.24488 type:complete len:200 (-) Transcript_11601:753-1352(-)
MRGVITVVADAVPVGVQPLLWIVREVVAIVLNAVAIPVLQGHVRVLGVDVLLVGRAITVNVGVGVIPDAVLVQVGSFMGVLWEDVLTVRDAIVVDVVVVGLLLVIGVLVLLIRHAIAIPVRVSIVSDAISIQVSPLLGVFGEGVLLVRLAVSILVGILAVWNSISIHVGRFCWRWGWGHHRRLWRRGRCGDLVDLHLLR